MNIYALKISSKMTAEIYNDLQEKEIARYGWSYVETSDLIGLQDKISQNKWKDLTEEEKDCWKANFLLRIKPEDYIVYINTPTYGRCTIAKVVEEYKWENLGEDFNHTLRIDRGSIREFNRNDKAIDSVLQRRFKLQGKYWQIYCVNEFKKLIEDLKDNILTGETSTVETRYNKLISGIEGYLCEISNEITKHHAEKTLEELIEMVFKKIPNVLDVVRFEGLADKGADLMVTYTNGLDFFGIEKEEKCIVQVKSYSGCIECDQAIKDIERSFNYYTESTCGLIMTTATEVSESFKSKLEELRDNSKKPIGFIYGAELSKWFIKYGI